MIITCKKRISFLWIVLAALPWVAMLFKDKLMGAAFTASMLKFVDNPRELSFVLGLAPLISLLVPTLVNFFGDRIWTRWGRRKPFIVVAWIGTVTCITLMPLAPSFAILTTLYVLFVICNDFGAPAESLKMEIVPPAQRPVSTAVVHWVNQVGVIIYFWVALGRFDEVQDFLGGPVTGQQGLFWTVAIAMVVMLCFLMLGIRETNPHSRHKGKFGFFDFFRGLFSNHIWPLYILTFSTVFTGVGIGFNDYLLLTEQWGYTNQDVGNNIAIGGALNLLLIPLIGMVANRTGRFRVYVTLIALGIVLNITRYFYFEFVLYDGRPTILEMVVFGEVFSILGILTSIALVPLIYDYISRNELGVYASGSGLIRRGLDSLLTVLIGNFVVWYAAAFLAPAGESSYIALRQDLPQSQVEKAVKAAPWIDPAGTSQQTLAKPNLTARPVYATGARLDHGYGYEIRLGNEDSSLLRKQRDAADGKRSAAQARLSYARKNASGSMGALAAKYAAEADREQVIVDENKAIVAKIEAELQRRADAFRRQVEANLAPLIMPDGDQVLGVDTAQAVIVSLPLHRRPAVEDIESTLDTLRRSQPGLIDMRLTGDPPRTLEISVLAQNDESGTAIVSAVRQSAAPGLIASLKPGAIPTHRTERAITLDLRTFEDPLDRHPSPINRGLESVLGWLIGRHDPERRLRAVGRGLRRAGWIEHVSARTTAADERSVRITAVVGQVPAGFLPGTESGDAKDDRPKPAERPTPAVLARFSKLDEPDIARAAGLYAVAVRATKEGRLTIARPVVEATVAKQQYDYLAGYVAVFVVQLLGVGVIFIFIYMVKTGRVTKLGVIEAEATR